MLQEELPLGRHNLVLINPRVLLFSLSSRDLQVVVIFCFCEFLASQFAHFYRWTLLLSVFSVAAFPLALNAQLEQI